MSRKVDQQDSGIVAPEMRLKECELFELVHVVRVRPVLKESQKGIYKFVVYTFIYQKYKYTIYKMHDWDIWKEDYSAFAKCPWPFSYFNMPRM